MKHNVTDLDQEAYETLLPIAGIEDPNALYEGMNGAKMSYDGMTTEEASMRADGRSSGNPLHGMDMGMGRGL